MTQYLASAAREVVAVEIDKALIPILSDTLSAFDNVTVINDDVLKVDINALAQERNNGKPIKVVANLPYYITTPIIMGLFESNVPIESITVMVQKEVADRMQVGQGNERLRRFIPCRTVLRKTIYCCKRSAKLLYAKT